MQWIWFEFYQHDTREKRALIHNTWLQSMCSAECWLNARKIKSKKETERTCTNENIRSKPTIEKKITNLAHQLWLQCGSKPRINRYLLVCSNLGHDAQLFAFTWTFNSWSISLYGFNTFRSILKDSQNYFWVIWVLACASSTNWTFHVFSFCWHFL